MPMPLGLVVKKALKYLVRLTALKVCIAKLAR
jgi:hypothetical protein